MEQSKLNQALFRLINLWNNIYCQSSFASW